MRSADQSAEMHMHAACNFTVERSELRTPNSKLRSILLVDTVGELGAWWGAASIGFVGGSLFSSRGGQNMIEPAAYGVATCFGPNTQNFRDVVAMLSDRRRRGASQQRRRAHRLRPPLLNRFVLRLPHSASAPPTS